MIFLFFISFPFNPRIKNKAVMSFFFQQLQLSSNTRAFRPIAPQAKLVTIGNRSQSAALHHFWKPPFHCASCLKLHFFKDTIFTSGFPGSYAVMAMNVCEQHFNICCASQMRIIPFEGQSSFDVQLGSSFNYLHVRLTLYLSFVI